MKTIQKTIQYIATVLAIPLLMLLITLPLSAQDRGEPEEGVEEFVFKGESGPPPIVLPPARKGEVFDTTLYALLPGDTLIFGERITNLQGDGGRLPVYGEFDDPLVVNVEGSIGTYVSPRGGVSLEYAVDRWNGRGLLDIGSTAGHVEGAEASSLLFDGHLEYQIPGQLPSPGKARAGLGISFGSDSYKLYGNSVAPFDRTRSIFDLDLGMASETDATFDYQVNLSVESVSLNDDTLGVASKVSALTPTFGAHFRLGNDSLNVSAGVRYQSTSLDYDTITSNPDFVEASGMVEWSPSPGLFVTAGGIIAHGGFSDSGSSTLLMPRGAIRYEVSENLAIFGRFAPELRAPSYRSRIMQASYVNREITLRPEKVLIRGGGGVRLTAGKFNIEGEAFFEKSENRPVVTLVGEAGELRWSHRDSRTVGVRGGLNATVGEKIALFGELTIANSVDEVTDEQLPMHSTIEAEGRVNFSLTDEIHIFGTLNFVGEQNITSDFTTLPAGIERTIDPQFLLGGGAEYRLTNDPNVSLFAEVTNLLAQSYQWWQNYEAPGLELRVGARARF
ncbi:MAG: TonB-dependent receptor [Candidatus Kapaibacterium sp.]